MTRIEGGKDKKRIRFKYYKKPVERLAFFIETSRIISYFKFREGQEQYPAPGIQ